MKKQPFQYFDIIKYYRDRENSAALKTLFFESDSTPVIISAEDNYICIALKNTIVKIESLTSLTYDQFTILDCITKGIYYEKILNPMDFVNYMRGLRCTRKNLHDKMLEVAKTIRLAIDHDINMIEIKETGEILTSLEPLPIIEN